jgi:predicted nucleic acid-binding protein
VADVTVVDASILIAHLDDTDPHSDAASTILADAEVLAASTLTLAEVFVGPARAGRLADAISAVDQIGIREVALGQSDAEALARLRAESGLRLPDCCVLHACAVTGARAIATRDQRLAGVAAARGLETP